MTRSVVARLLLILGFTLPILGSFSTVSAQTSGARAHDVASVRIFLIALNDGGKSGPKVGCGDSVVSVEKRVKSTKAPLRAALNALLSVRTAYYGQSGLYDALYAARLRISKLQVIGGIARVHLAGRLNLRGECDNPRVAAQLRYTIHQFPAVRSWWISINNVPLKRVLSLKG